MAILRSFIATAFWVAAVASPPVGMADTSTEMKEQRSRTVTEVPAPSSEAQQDTQVETHTSTSKQTHQDEADGSVQMKKESATIEERAAKTAPVESDTVHSETESKERTTTVTP